MEADGVQEEVGNQPGPGDAFSSLVSTVVHAYPNTMSAKLSPGRVPRDVLETSPWFTHPEVSGAMDGNEAPLKGRRQTRLCNRRGFLKQLIDAVQGILWHAKFCHDVSQYLITDFAT